MKLIDICNAFCDVCVLYNPQPFYFSVFYLDSGVTTHPTVVRGIQLSNRREYVYLEPAYPVGLYL